LDLEVYISGLKELDSLKTDVIVPVCNTINVYHKMLQETISTPILNLREEVRRELIKQGISKASVLATPSTIKNGLYSFDFIKYTAVNRKDLDILSKAIFNYNIGYKKDEQKRNVEEIYQKYLKQSEGTIIIGCTELSLMLGEKSRKRTVDTFDVLVDSTVSLYLKNRL
jgi:aspartate/glutamate racemase